MKRTMIAALLTLALSPLAFAETLYVQPAQTQLREAPKMDAKAIAELKRGEALTVVKREGIWIQVKSAAKEGWISKLFVSPNRPVGEADLKKIGEDENVGKASRRRASSYAASAATRGLAPGNRTREGREAYPSDPKAVEKLEGQAIPEAELKKFQEAGKLKAQ